jgi:hypothetical protein
MPVVKVVFIAAHGSQLTDGDNKLEMLDIPENIMICANCKSNACMVGSYKDDADVLQSIHDASAFDDGMYHLIDSMKKLENNSWCLFDIFPEMIFTPSNTRDPFFSAKYTFKFDEDPQTKRCKLLSKLYEPHTSFYLSSLIRDYDRTSSRRDEKLLIILYACRVNTSGNNAYGLNAEFVNEPGYLQQFKLINKFTGGGAQRPVFLRTNKKMHRRTIYACNGKQYVRVMEKKSRKYEYIAVAVSG